MDTDRQGTSPPAGDADAPPAFYVRTGDLVDFVAAKVSGSVCADIVQREERRGKRNALIFSLLGLVGLGGVTGVVSWRIEAAVEQRLETALAELGPSFSRLVAREVGQRIGEVDQRLQDTEVLQELIEDVNRLADATEFPPSLRDAIMKNVRLLAPKERYHRSGRFIAALRDVVTHFAAAGLDEDIDEIDTLVGEQIKLDTRIALDLSDHYGENIIGSPLPVPREAERIARVQKYLSAASVNGYPEKQKMWELFIEFKRQALASGPVTDRIVESLGDLDDADRGQFFKFVKLYSSPSNWQRIETQEGREMARLVEALLSAYPSLRDDVARAPHLLRQS